MGPGPYLEDGWGFIPAVWRRETAGTSPAARYASGWTDDNIRREGSAGPVVLLGGEARRRGGRAASALRIVLNPGMQPVVVALVEANG